MRPSRILRRWIGTRSGNATDRRTVRGRRRRVRGGRRKRLPKWWHVASRVPTVPQWREGKDTRAGAGGGGGTVMTTVEKQAASGARLQSKGTPQTTSKATRQADS